MTKVFPFLILAVLFFQPVQSQTDGSVPYLTDSSRSIQFGIESFYLRAFDGQSLSYRWHRSPLTAVRIGVEFSAYGSTDETTTSTFHGDTLLGRRHSTVTQMPRFNVSLTANYLWNLPVQQDLFLFAGIGPRIGYSQYAFGWYEESRSWFGGMTGGIGAEWFAAQRISLHGEYQYRLLFRHTKSKDSEYSSANNYEQKEITSNSFELSSGNVNFGLSVHF